MSLSLPLYNQNVSIITIMDLIKLNLVIPKWQRHLDLQRVQTIYQHLTTTPFNQIIQTGIIVAEMKSTHYLIDGQHRYHAFLKLYNEKHIVDMNILIITIPIQTDDEMFQVCRIINDTYKFDLPAKPSSNIEAKIVVEHFESKYKNFFSDSLNCKRPNVYKNTLLTGIAQFLESNPTLNPEDAIKELEKFNEFCHLQFRSGNFSFFLYNGDDVDKIKNIKSRKKISPPHNLFLYLGMFPRNEFLNKMKNYHNELANMTTQTTSKTEQEKKSNVQEFDKKTRNLVWKSRTHSNYSKCWNCTNLVYKNDFHIRKLNDENEFKISCQACLEQPL